MSKYTQGKWGTREGDFRNNGRGEFIEIDSEDGVPITAIYEKDDEFEGVTDEMRANAQLIASAPKLLEALKGLLSCNLSQNLIGGYQLYIENAEKIINEIEGGYYE